jgi:putative FmdB family regulatory protein
MPIYEYRCPECEQIFEEWQSNHEEREVECPVCGASSKRIMSNTSFVLKGSGWYVTDYCNKKESNNGAESKKDEAVCKSADTKKESPAKTETPAKPAAPSASSTS